MGALDTTLLWIGAAVTCSGALLVLVVLWFFTLEYALKVFGLNKLIIRYYWEKLQRSRGRIITTKSEFGKRKS